MMGKQQGARKLAYLLFAKSPKEINRYDAACFLETYVKPKSKLRADGSSIYKGIHNWRPVRHQNEIHSKWEFEITSE